MTLRALGVFLCIHCTCDPLINQPMLHLFVKEKNVNLQPPCLRFPITDGRLEEDAVVLVSVAVETKSDF